jgi:hypothetical protein
LVLNTMRYFTRNWYNRIQECDRNWSPFDQDTSNSEFTKLSNEAIYSYKNYYETIKDTIDKNVRQLMELGLGDVLIVDVKQNEDILHLFLKFFWDRKRQSRAINIHFSGVIATSGIESCIGDEILNTEIFVKPDSSYEYSVLLRNSEIAVSFRSVSVEGEPIIYPNAGNIRPEGFIEWK